MTYDTGSKERMGPHTCDSYGRKAMLISLRVFILRAAIDLHTSLNSSSGHTAIEVYAYDMGEAVLEELV